jgi:hypothetical protein
MLLSILTWRNLVAEDDRAVAVKKLEERLWSITEANGYPLTVVSVIRTPKSPNTKFPCINVFEMDDVIEERLIGGDRGWYLRNLEVILEFWREASSDEAAAIEAYAFRDSIRYALFAGDEDLGGLCDECYEKATSRIMRPPMGKAVVGMAITLGIRYTDTRSYAFS